MLDVNWILLDSDLTGFPASHAIWDRTTDPRLPGANHVSTSSPRARLGLDSPPETSVSSRCRPQCSRVFKFDRPGPRPRRVKAFLGPQQKVRIRRYVRTDSASALIRGSRARWPHLGVNGPPLNSPPVPKTNTDGGKSANTKACKSRASSHALTLLFRNPALTSCCAPFHPP